MAVLGALNALASNSQAAENVDVLLNDVLESAVVRCGVEGIL